MNSIRLEQLSILVQEFAHINCHPQLTEDLVKRTDQCTINVPLTEILNSVSIAMDLNDDDFYEYCFSKLAITPPKEVFRHRQPTPTQLIYKFLDFMLDEEDEASGKITVQLFSKLIHETDLSLQTQDFLRLVTKRYIESTRHLIPHLHLCTDATLKAAARCKSGEIYLFLRDGLCFWPAFRSKIPGLSSPPSIKHLIYTRSHFKQQRRPLVVSEHGSTAESMSPVTLGTFLDVGIYGTLIERLDRMKLLVKDNIVMFLYSMNPKIGGFINQYKKADGNPYTQTEAIALVDTVESLMKPFQIDKNALQELDNVTVRQSDPISFLCSVAFMRQLYRFQDTYYDGIPGSWHLQDPIPPWVGANEFISKWNVTSCLDPSRYIKYIGDESMLLD